MLRYAEAWEFAAFWYRGVVLDGFMTANKSGVAYLEDSRVDFVAFGFRPDEGMTLYNLTTGGVGYVCAVTEKTLRATWLPNTGAAAKVWSYGDLYRATTLTAMQVSEIEHSLEITAGNIRIAAQAGGAAGCTLSEAGAGLLKKLNIIEAAAFFTEQCGTPNFEDAAERANLRDWTRFQLEDIRAGKLDLCEGGTGIEFPAFAIAEHAYGELSAAAVVARRNWRGRENL